MQLLFVLPLFILLLKPYHTESYTCETERSLAPSEVFADKVIRRNPEAAMKTWANVQPTMAIKGLTADQGNFTFNTVEQLLEKGNVENNKMLVKALKTSIVQEADQFFKVYMREYPNDLLEVFKEEPKEPFLRTLSASSPHAFLKNIFRAYGLESEDEVEEGSLGGKFVKYFVDRYPAESMETMMGRNDGNINEMWFSEVKRRRLSGNITKVKDLKEYAKTIKDENDGIFRDLRYKIAEAVKEDRRNFFTHFSTFGKENVLIESIADFDANAYFKSLIQYKPEDFRVALLKSYQLDKEFNASKELKRKEIEILHFMKPAVRNFFKDLLKNSFSEFKEVAEKMGYPKNKLTEKLKGEGRDWRKETKDFKDLMKWIQGNFKKFYTSLHKKNSEKACKHFANVRHNQHMINQLMVKNPGVLIRHLQSQENACLIAFFVSPLITDLTDDELRHLIRTNEPLFEDALKGLDMDLFKKYQTEFHETTPKKFAEKYWVSKDVTYRYINFYFNVYKRKYKEFVMLVHRALPDAFARTTFRSHYWLGCSLALSSLLEVLLPALVTGSDDFIDHLAIEHKYEMVKTIMRVDREAAFEFVKNQNCIPGYEVNELNQLKKHIEMRPDWLSTRIIREGAKHQGLLNYTFVAEYVQKHPKKVLDYLLKTYPYVFEDFLAKRNNSKILDRLADDYPVLYLKHHLKAESVNRRREERNTDDLREKHVREIEENGKIILKELLYEDEHIFMEEFLKEYTFEDYFNESLTVDVKGDFISEKKDRVHVEVPE